VGLNAGARERVMAGVEAPRQRREGHARSARRSVVIEKSWGAPTISKDGVTIAREIELPKQVREPGRDHAQGGRDQHLRRRRRCTTTATVLAQSIYREGSRLVTAGHDPMELKRGIDIAIAAAVESLKGLSTSTGASGLAQVGSLRAAGDIEIGTVIAEAMRQVGKDGVITVEEGSALTSAVEFARGMQLDRATHRRTSRATASGWCASSTTSTSCCRRRGSRR